MEKYDSLSPFTFRYGREELLPYLSEAVFIQYQAKVEAALVQALANRKLCSQAVADEITAACDQISADEVYVEEQRIKHNIRALVNCIRNKVSDGAKPFVHLGATSHDIVCTADALRCKEVTLNVLLPSLIELESTLIAIARKEKDTIQIGRTHGQHAVPVTFGYFMAGYVARLGECYVKIFNAAHNLRGQFSGAVGAYNASALFFDDPDKFEKEILALLNLQPGTHSTQVVQPEFTLDLCHAIISCYGIFANLSDDMRHLQRTEINEVAETFGKDQVGSSTMPHKRNPINFENVKSLWKVTYPRILTVYQDQISEHQRDLTNSASSRFIPEIMAAFYESSRRLHRQLTRLVVDEENMKENFDMSKDRIISEPLYILLAYHNHPDAHEAVRRLTIEADYTKKPLPEVVFADPSLQPYLLKLSEQQKAMLRNPKKYIGIAAEKTESVCTYWGEKLAEVNNSRPAMG